MSAALTRLDPDTCRHLRAVRHVQRVCGTHARRTFPPPWLTRDEAPTGYACAFAVGRRGGLVDPADVRAVLRGLGYAGCESGLLAVKLDHDLPAVWLTYPAGECVLMLAPWASLIDAVLLRPAAGIEHFTYRLRAVRADAAGRGVFAAICALGGIRPAAAYAEARWPESP